MDSPSCATSGAVVDRLAGRFTVQQLDSVSRERQPSAEVDNPSLQQLGALVLHRHQLGLHPGDLLLGGLRLRFA